MNRYEQSDRMVVMVVGWLLVFATSGFFAWMYLLIYLIKKFIL